MSNSHRNAILITVERGVEMGFGMGSVTVFCTTFAEVTKPWDISVQEEHKSNPGSTTQTPLQQ